MRWLAVFFSVAIAAIIIYRSNFPSYSYRYRLQISLSIEDKVYTGSSIIEVMWGCGPKVADSGRCSPSLRGQATLIDIGARGVVVATLYSGENYSPIPDGAIEAVWLCANAFNNRSTNEELPALTKLRGRRNLSPSNFPRLVWFPKPADPKSARKITMQNVGIILDPTAHFTEAFVEITGAPSVVDIANKLPWLPAMQREQMKSGILSMPGQFQLTYRMFVGD